jgi:4-oxalocrotonate tautomerase
VSRLDVRKEMLEMPLATIKLIEGVLSGDEKQRMIEKVTEAMVSVEGESLRDKTVVILEEVRSGDWGVGGKTLTTGAVKQLRAGR